MRGRPKRLVLSGYYGFGNAGDEAILAGVIAAFRSVDPTVELVVLSGDPDGTRAEHRVPAVTRALLPTLRALRRSAGLVSGGGGLFQDRTSVRSLGYYAGLVVLARLVGRPVFIYAQGVGPLRRRTSRWVVANVLRLATSVSVRDQGSLRAVRATGFRGAVEVVPDPALGLSRPDIAPGSARPATILVALREWPESGDVERAVAEALSGLTATNRVVFVAMDRAMDRAVTSRSARRIDGAEIAEWGNLDELRALIGAAALVVGMRLHALVLAAAAGIPFVAISYDPKVDAFAEAVGQPVGGAVTAHLAADQLAELVRRQLKTDPSRYRAIVTEIARGAERPARAILDELDRRSAAAGSR